MTSSQATVFSDGKNGHFIGPGASWPRRMLITLVLILIAGCSQVAAVFGSTWHAKFGWKAESFFDDPKVISLCKAIEANDLKEIDRLVAAGADVNARGKGNMTPLLWAYPDNKLERFKRMLEHGADPNVIIESDFKTHGGMMPGDSVTHMACRTTFPGYFEVVFDHGGDVNLVLSGKGHVGDTPLHLAIEFGGSRRKEKIKTLLERGANINAINDSELTLPMLAVLHGGQYDLALFLLEEGADFRFYPSDSNSRLIHILISDAIRRGPLFTPEHRPATRGNGLNLMVSPQIKPAPTSRDGHRGSGRPRRKQN
jgi:hypothetical protein